MSKCKIKRNFCMTHKCWVSVQDDTACPMSVLAAQVERLTAERDILRAANAVKAERIDAALALLQPDAGGWCDCLAHRIGRALRGGSDE